MKKNIVLGFVLLAFILGCAGAKPATRCVKTTKKSLPKQNFNQPKISIDKAELETIVQVFSEDIKKHPHQPGNYYNRAFAYFLMKEYQMAWDDVHMAEKLGMQVSPEFIRKLTKASGKTQ